MGAGGRSWQSCNRWPRGCTWCRWCDCCWWRLHRRWCDWRNGRLRRSRCHSGHWGCGNLGCDHWLRGRCRRWGCCHCSSHCRRCRCRSYGHRGRCHLDGRHRCCRHWGRCLLDGCRRRCRHGGFRHPGGCDHGRRCRRRCRGRCHWRGRQWGCLWCSLLPCVMSGAPRCRCLLLCHGRRGRRRRGGLHGRCGCSKCHG
jgi:hypothetical protein